MLKRTKKPHKPKTDRQKATAYLDSLWRDVVRLRDLGLCQYCGKEGNQAHHIVTRGAKNTRWDTENGITLCQGHHYSIAHQRPERFREFLVTSWMSAERYGMLQLRGNTPAKGLDLQLIGLALASQLKELKAAI
jgi:hypothetical protein